MIGFHYYNDRRSSYNPFQRRRYEPTPEPIIKDSLRKNNITKDGHLFKKSIGEGDDKLLLEPHRYYNDGIFLYKRYNLYQHDNTALLTDCGCHHAGYICDYCEVLNTSFFYDLEVPLNSEDWTVLKKIFLVQYKWSEKNFYHWLSFWINVEQNRHNDRKGLVFFNWSKFFRHNRNAYTFFYYLFKFISEGKVLKPYIDKYAPRSIDMNDGIMKGPIRGQRVKENCVAINTCDTMIRLTFQIYGKGGRITNIKTQYHKYSVIEYTYQDDTRCDKFSIHQKKEKMEERRRWKRVFQYTIDQINEEVRFRPGMCGMEDCMSSFVSSLSKLTDRLN